jgi:hypothetical protein
MMAWVHASIGAFVGGRVGSPKRAFTAGTISHGIADLVPHRDYHIKIELPLVLITLAYVALRYGLRSSELAGAIGGIFPDTENVLHRFGIVKKMLYPTHTRFQWSLGHGRAIKSPLTQIALALACLYLANRLARGR